MTEPGKRTVQDWWAGMFQVAMKFAEAYHAHAQQLGAPAGTLLAPNVAKRMGLKIIDVAGLWLRRIGDHVEMLAENPWTGEWVEVAREHFDGPFSHIVEPNGIDSRFRYSERAASPASEAPPARTCPTCGMDIRCIHGVLFQDKCEPCEAPDPPATEADRTAHVPAEHVAVNTRREAAEAAAQEKRQAWERGRDAALAEAEKYTHVEDYCCIDEAIEAIRSLSYPGATEAQTAIPQRVFFGRPGQDIPARRNETVYLREDGQSIVIHHDEALLSLLGSELLNKIKAWAMGAEAQTKEAD